MHINAPEFDVYKLFFDPLDIQVIVYDENLKVLYLNPKFMKDNRIGYEIYGKTDLENYNKMKNVYSSVENHSLYLEKAIMSKKVGEYTEQINYNRPKKYLSRKIIPLLDENDQTIRLIEYGIDKSNSEVIENKMTVMMKMMQASSKISGITEYAYDVISELDLILGTYKLLDIDSPKKERYRANLIRHINTSNKSTLYTLESDNNDLRIDCIEECNINNVIHDLEPIYGLLSDKPIKIKYDLDGRIGNTMLIKSEIELIMLNLISNSIAAITDNNEITIITKFLTTDKDLDSELEIDLPLIMIAVMDKGKGIPEEAKLSLFNAENTLLEKKVGLGLYATYNLVQNNDGYFSIVSNENQGTEIRIFLPVY